MVSISLMMMVKDEEANIASAILSTEGLVDEVFIGDTGSTDNTVKIAKHFGKVFETPFVNYVETRQKILEQITTDYVVMIDADERLTVGHEELRQLAEEDVDGVLCTLQMFNQNHTPIVSFPRYVLWRNDGRWHFQGPKVHEYLTGGYFISRPNIRIEHTWQPPIVSEEPGKTYIRFLLEAIKENKDDSRAWFYLARTYYDIGKWSEAVETYQKYLELPNIHNGERWQSFMDLSLCYKIQGNFEEAIKTATLAVECCPNRAESYNVIGSIYFYNLKNPFAAIGYFEKARTLKMPEADFFVHQQDYTIVPNDMLTLCYYETRQWDKAIVVCSELNDTLKGRDARIVDNLKQCLSRGE